MADPETCFGIDLNGLDKNREIFGDQGLLVYFQGSYYSESALEAGALTWSRLAIDRVVVGDNDSGKRQCTCTCPVQSRSVILIAEELVGFFQIFCAFPIIHSLF